MISVVSIIGVLILLIIFVNIIKFGLKVLFITILVCLATATVFVCTNMPDMHKPVSLNTIEYLFKINKDGSMTTTKQITQTVVTRDNER